MINDPFISEVISRQRWRPRRRGGRLSPPRKLYGKNLLYAFVMLYLKDGHLKKEFGKLCNAFEMLRLKDGPLRRSSECLGLCNVVPYRRSLKEF